MEVFGSFEATEVAREGNFGAIMYARKAGVSDRKFAIKVFRPPEFLMDDDQIVRESEAFLESAEAQQRAHGAAPGVWAPVYEMGKCSGGAWYATDLLEGSLEWLRITQRDLEPEHIRKVIEPIVQGLLALKVGQGRAHGNLKATNVLLMGRADLSRARVLLCDPKPASRCKSPDDDQNDARDLGNLVHQLILHRQFQNATEWPLQNSDAWKRLGKTGASWLDVVNRLIDPTTTKKPTIQEISGMLPGGPVASPAGGKAASPAPSEADRKAKEEAEKRAREEDERRKRNEAEIARKVREQAEKEAAAKAEAERKAKEDAQRKAEADAKAREEAQRKAELDRKAREEADRKAREEAERKAKEDAERKAREAETARKAQEEAARKAQEEETKRQAERAEADRKAKEAAEKKAKDEAERKARAEEERRAKEEEARTQAELKARQKAEQQAKEAERVEAEKKAREEAKQRAQQEAERKKTEAAEAKARAAAAATTTAATASAEAKADAPWPAAEVERAGSKPAAGGSKKGIMIAAAALVAVAGTVGVILAMRGGGGEATPSGDGGGTNPPVVDGGKPGTDPPTGPEPDQTPTPTSISAQEIAAAVTKRLPEFEKRVGDDLTEAARAAVASHRTTSTDRLKLVATTEANRVVERAAVEAPAADVRAQAQRAAQQAVASGFGQGLNPSAPTRASRPSLAAIATDLSKTVQGDLASADASQVDASASQAVDALAGRLWSSAVASAANAVQGEVAAQLADAAADAARSAFEAKVAAASTPEVRPADPPPKVDPPPAPTITQADIEAARQQVAAIAATLDGGGALDAASLSTARERLQAAEGAKGYEQIRTEPQTARVRARLEAIGQIVAASAGEILPLVQGASSQTGGASELIAAWNRLGQVGQNVGMAQLVEARTAAVAALGGFGSDAQGRARAAVDAAVRQLWAQQALSAASEQAINQLRAAKDTLEVPDEGVPPVYAFNVALLDFKTQIKGVSSAGDERLTALKEPAARFVQRVSAIGPISQEQAVQNAIAWANEIVNFAPAAAQPSGTGDLSRAGPGSAGWTKSAESPDGMQVEYTLPAVGNRFREERLVFYRVGNAYLSASEVPVALFRRLFGEAEALEEIRGAYTDPASGLKVWRVNNRVVQLNEQLARSPDITNPQQLAAWGGRPASELNPGQAWPVQYISPRGAAVAAGKMGCRLPTLDEWRSAVQSDPQAAANLRDSEWFEVLAAARAFKFVGAPIYPDSGAVKAEGTRAQGPAAPDGYPFFAPVDGDGFGSRWKHLRGNVAEWVFTALPAGPEPIVQNLAGFDSGWEMGVVGGSAVSPPSFAAPDQVISDHNNRGWFDVGFRLAFSAPGGVAAAPAPSPVIGRVAQLEGLGYLVAGRQ